jgi:hypothetical protein
VRTDTSAYVIAYVSIRQHASGAYLEARAAVRPDAEAREILVARVDVVRIERRHCREGKRPARPLYVARLHTNMYM